MNKWRYCCFVLSKTVGNYGLEIEMSLRGIHSKNLWKGIFDRRHDNFSFAPWISAVCVPDPLPPAPLLLSLSLIAGFWALTSHHWTATQPEYGLYVSCTMPPLPASQTNQLPARGPKGVPRETSQGADTCPCPGPLSFSHHNAITTHPPQNGKIYPKLNAKYVV